MPNTTIPAMPNTWTPNTIPSDAYVEAGSASQAVGSGSAKVLAQHLLPGPLNVKAFGATGAGVLDDTAAIQSALNFAATGNGQTGPRGIVVFIPAGIYNITALTMKRGVELRGAGPDMTILKKTGTTDIGIAFDSTALTPTTVQDKVTIRDLSVWQSGAASAGAGISVRGVSSDARLILERVRINNCYRGLITFNTIQTYINGCEIYSSISDGFKFTGSSYLMTVINSFSAGNGTGGAGNGFELADGNYCNFVGCGADNNHSGDGFYLTGCHFSSLLGCGNERNLHGAHLINCGGCTIDTLYTLVDSFTVNAVLLDASNNTEIRNLGSAHVNPSYGTYMVSAINSSAYNSLSIGYLSDPWPSGATDSPGAFVDIQQNTSRRITGPLTVKNPMTIPQVILDGSLAPAPGIDAQGSYPNEKRIIALYSNGNVFAGLGMDASSLGIRVAGELAGAGLLLDVGYYSSDGAFTWTSIGKIDGQGNFTIKRGITCTNGVVKLNLPTSAGATGELWNDAGTVKVAP